MSEQLLTSGDVAAWLNVRPQTLADWRCKGVGPSFIRFSAKKIRYRREVVEAWLLERELGANCEFRGDA